MRKEAEGGLLSVLLEAEIGLSDISRDEVFGQHCGFKGQAIHPNVVVRRLPVFAR